MPRPDHRSGRGLVSAFGRAGLHLTPNIDRPEKRFRDRFGALSESAEGGRVEGVRRGRYTPPCRPDHAAVVLAPWSSSPRAGAAGYRLPTHWHDPSTGRRSARTTALCGSSRRERLLPCSYAQESYVGSERSGIATGRVVTPSEVVPDSVCPFNSGVCTRRCICDSKCHL